MDLLVPEDKEDGNITMLPPSTDQLMAGYEAAQTHSSNASTAPAQNNTTHSRFLNLARELRDMIYELLIVYKDPEDTAITLCEVSELRSARRQRHTFLAFDCPYEIQQQAMSYEAQVDSDILQRPSLSILKVNRQIYHEAATTFYSKNHFSFRSFVRWKDLSILTFRAFLTDRSHYALANIRSVEFTIICSGSEGFSSDAHDGELSSLITFINKNMSQLQHVTLNLQGLPISVRALDTTFPEFQSPENQDQHPWFLALIQLRELKSLYIRHRIDHEVLPFNVSPNLALECMASIAGFVRAHILQGGEKLGVRNLRAHSRHVAQFTFGTWKRKIERFILLECHDNVKGESLLQPVTRLSPRREGALELLLSNRPEKDRQKSVNYIRQIVSEGDHPFTIYADDVYENAPDWDMSDDGENDSLNGEDLSGLDTDYVMDDRLLAHSSSL